MNFFPFTLIGSVGFMVAANLLHGLIQTEVSVIDGWSGKIMLIFNRWNKWSNTVIAFLLMVLTTLLAIDALFVAGLWQTVLELAGPYLRWLLILPGINIGLAIIDWLLFWFHNLRRFGTTRPDYGNWPAWDEVSNRPGHTTVIVHDGTGSVWPFRSVGKASLSDRATTRSQRSSSVASSQRSSSMGSTSQRSSILAIPIPIGGGSISSKKSQRSSSGGKKTDTSWITGLGQLAILLIAVVIAVLYALGAWKFNDLMLDFWDEVFVAKEYAE